jgi:alkylation response protein AidB-like acyl-CoA dehydrogenase
MAMVTSTVTVTSLAYVSLGTTQSGAGMLLNANGPIQVVAAASQPAANTVGHPINYEQNPTYLPFLITGTQVWAIGTTQQAGGEAAAPQSVSVLVTV